jgi:hypothetical protein
VHVSGYLHEKQIGSVVAMDFKKKKKKKNKKCWGATARGVPKRSPIQVLTAPDVA